jgi:hypothetical protein
MGLLSTTSVACSFFESEWVRHPDPRRHTTAKNASRRGRALESADFRTIVVRV